MDKEFTRQGYYLHKDFSATLNQTDIRSNANKFYIIQVCTNGGRFVFFRRYGRVGMRGNVEETELSTAWEAEGSFKRVFRDKTGLHWQNRDDEPKKGKYVFMKLKAASPVAAAAATSTLDPAVTTLVTDICNPELMKTTMVSYNVDVKKMPLGALSKQQIDKSRLILKDLEDAIAAGGDGMSETLITLSSSFWTLIPRATKLNQRPPVVETLEMIKELAEMLDTLENIQVASVAMSGNSTIDGLYASLRADIRPCTPEETDLVSFLLSSTASHHHLIHPRSIAAYVVDKGMQDALDTAKVFQRTPNHVLLFHGSRTANFMGILTEGLRVPAPNQVSNGSSLGMGCYFANCSTKSLQYTGGAASASSGYLLICEVALGTPHEVTTSEPRHLSLCRQPNGQLYDSRRALGQWAPMYAEIDGLLYPKGPLAPRPHGQSGSYIHDEFVIFNPHQYRMRYLVRVQF